MLCELLGSRNCYYSPPAGMHLKYPCIVYQLADDDRYFADNIPYIKNKRWTVTVIDKDPDSDIPSRFDDIQFTSFDRFFTVDNLNHFVFTIYY